jgi:hypothetical protein
MRELVDFVQENEERPLIYQMYLDEDAKLMTVVQAYPDSESLDVHMRAAGPVFAKFAENLRMISMDVYGMPSPVLLEQLRRKAEMLGGSALKVHALQAGFARTERTVPHAR